MTNPAWLSRAKRVIRDGERGVSAVILALSMTVMMGAAAIGFDIAKLYYERQMVRNAVDAAAQAGAAQLPTAGSAAATALRTTVKQLASLNFPDLPSSAVTVSFLCVVANKSGVAGTIAAGAVVDAAQIPATCNPGTYAAADVKCSASSCAIPCPDSATCNAVTVSANKRVDFVFAPAININSANTGAVTTLSCRGSCGGQAPPNPMNVVVMADRTPSMHPNYGAPTGAFQALKDGIEGMLQNMTPNQQYVAFGALHKSTNVSVTSGTDNLTQPLPSGAKIFNENTTSNTYCDAWKVGKSKIDANCTHWTTTTTTTRTNEFAGSWVPVDFTKSYLTSTGALSTTSDLYSSVHNLTYSNLTSGGSYVYNKMLNSDGTYDNAGTGTHLAAALKGAARYLLSKVDSHNYIAGLDSDNYRKDLDIPVKNVIIFETDGQPDEIFTDATSDSDSALSLGNSDDIGNKSDDYRACENFKRVAEQVKAAGILMVTIGFGTVNSASCSNSRQSATARSVLAYAASTQASVTGTGTADSNCSTPAQIAAENSDSDYYYCAASANDLKSVFAAAMGSISGGTKYMAIDGLSD
jgi:Flp pilus assembly protein TadG